MNERQPKARDWVRVPVTPFIRATQKSGDPAALMAALGHRDLSTTQLYLSSPIERTAQLRAGVEDEFKGEKDE